MLTTITLDQLFSNTVLLFLCSLMQSGLLVWYRRVGRWDEDKKQRDTRRQLTLNLAVMSNGNHNKNY